MKRMNFPDRVRSRRSRALEQRTAELFDWELALEDPTNGFPDHFLSQAPSFHITDLIKKKIAVCERDIRHLERKLAGHV